MSEPHTPAPEEYQAYYGTYISKVGPEPLLEQLERNLDITLDLLARVGEAKADWSYAPGKWSLKTVVGHLSDTERVFAYRLLVGARSDPAALSSFDQDAWAATRDLSGVSLAALADEFGAVRRSTLPLLRTLTDADWGRTMSASGNAFSVRALAYTIAGHELHHQGLLRERYGLS